MHAEHRIRLEILEHAVLQHQRSPAFLVRRRTFLGRLEHEQHRTVQILAHATQRRGDAEQHRRVRVVAASVHHANRLAAIRAVRRGGKRQRHLLGDRQRIHVRAQGQPRPRLTTLQQRDHAGVGNAGVHFEPELAQLRGDQCGGTRFAIAELGVVMDVAPPRGDLRQLLLRQRARGVGGVQWKGRADGKDQRKYECGALHGAVPRPGMFDASVLRAGVPRYARPSTSRAQTSSGSSSGHGVMLTSISSG